MSSPFKRRKKNNVESSPKPIRSLDYFFGKQTKDSALERPAAEAPVDSFVENPISKDVEHEIPPTSDEDLARRLQQQWDDELESANHKTSTPLLAINHRNGETTEQHKNVTEEESVESWVVGSTRKAVLSLQSAVSAEDTISSTIPFEENPLIFDPTSFVPGLKAYWASEGGDASYSLLTRCFVLVNSTQSRIKIVDTLVNMLRIIIEGDPDSLLPAVSSGAESSLEKQ